jgi:hypothetical protein
VRRLPFSHQKCNGRQHGADDVVKRVGIPGLLKVKVPSEAMGRKTKCPCDVLSGDEKGRRQAVEEVQYRDTPHYSAVHNHEHETQRDVGIIVIH